MIWGNAYRVPGFITLLLKWLQIIRSIIFFINSLLRYFNSTGLR